MINVFLTSLIYLLLIMIVFFSKKRLKNFDNKVYSAILIITTFGVTLDIIQYSIIQISFPVWCIVLICKLFLIYILSWTCLFTTYILSLSLNDTLGKKLDIIKYCIFVIGILGVIILPMDYYNNGGEIYTTGLATAVVYVGVLLNIFIMLFSCIRNIKRNSYSLNKYIPLMLFILFGSIATIIQYIKPSVLLTSPCEAFITILTFFFIENPDLIMVEELTKAQQLSEKTSNEKINFLYTISSDIDNRINKIEEIYEGIKNSNNKEEENYYLEELKNNLTDSRNMLRRTINISDLDAQHIQLTNNKYNIRLLLDSVYSIMKANVKEGIDFRLSASDDLPDELYGDSMKVKQILASIISNSIKYTDKGSIELRASSVVKNSVCRLFLTVEDTGRGIDIFKQNEIMGNDEDLDKVDIDSLSNMDLSLKVVRKMISMIGGTFTIDSNKYNGTTVNITLNQRIVEDKKTTEEENIEKYSEAIKNQKTCAIITLDKDNSKIIKSVAKKKDYKVIESAVAKVILDEIRDNVHYDIVFIDEYMEKIDARSFLQKVKETEFNGKVFVIAANKDIKTKRELLDFGFDSIVLKPIDKHELSEKID